MDKKKIRKPLVVKPLVARNNLQEVGLIASTISSSTNM